MPGAKGNKNALIHGLHSVFTTGALPKGAKYVAETARHARKAIEAAVLEKRGHLTLQDVLYSQSAARHESRALLLQKWLRDRSDTLTHDQQVTLLKEIGAATDARDRAVKALGLSAAEVRESFIMRYAAVLANGPSPSQPAGTVIEAPATEPAE